MNAGLATFWMTQPRNANLSADARITEEQRIATAMVLALKMKQPALPNVTVMKDSLMTAMNFVERA